MTFDDAWDLLEDRAAFARWRQDNWAENAPKHYPCLARLHIFLDEHGRTPDRIGCYVYVEDGRKLIAAHRRRRRKP